MTTPRTAALVLLGSATLWGLSWWPMQTLAQAGVAGLPLALLAYGLATVVSLPLLWRERRAWLGRPRQVLLIALPGGWAAMSFMLAMSTGDVVREMLLFYLAPAWSVLGGVVLLGETVSRTRLLAVLLALAGAALVISAGGSVGHGALTVPDAFALSAGLAFAAGNLATRAASTIPLASKTTLQMGGCVLVAAAMVAVTGTPVPLPGPLPALGVVAFAAIWILGGTSTTAFGMSHLEASRSALILLAELVSAVVSASLVHQRVPQRLEWVGGLLILAAAALDAANA